MLSLKVIDPYICAWEVLGILAFLTFWSLPVIFLVGVIFLYYGIWRRKKRRVMKDLLIFKMEANWIKSHSPALSFNGSGCRGVKGSLTKKDK